MYFINKMSRTKLILFIANSNEKNYYSELHLKKMRLISLGVVIFLGHIMLTSRFAFCVVTIHAIVLPTLRFV